MDNGPTLSTGAGDTPPASNAASAPPPNPKLRKRTKTGCLTCRKRRIKCGEERPICNNCIKSKRHCEGYNQRVIFKPPIGDWPNHPSTVNTLPYHNSLLPGARPVYHRHPQPIQQQQQSQQQIPGSLTSIQPRSFDFSNVESGPIPGQDPQSAGVLVVGQPPPYSQDPNYIQQPIPSPHTQLPTPTSATSFYPASVNAGFPLQFANESNSSYQRQQYPQQGAQFQQIPVSYDSQAVEEKPVISDAPYTAASQAYQDQYIYQQRQSEHEEQDPYYLASSGPTRADEYQTQYVEQRAPLAQVANAQVPDSQTQQSSVDLGRGAYPPLQPGHHQAQIQTPQPDSYQDVKYVQHTILEQPTALSHATPDFRGQLLTSGFSIDHVSPTQVLDEAAVEYEDDDYYDVNSDEEMEDAPDSALTTNRDFGMILRIHQESTSELSIRRYDAFIYAGILDHYRAEWVANPLKNPKTARVFAHFIYATGPSLSIYERNPRNASAMFTEGPVPSSQQSLWTYTLPMMALNHQGLLHAMLALASLHIAKLQGASATPSFKHYAYALKRIHHCVGHSKKRHQVTTLAASLLLAFYEVMTADHLKWSSHLVGAKQLLVEIDYRGMTKQSKRMKAEQAAYEQMFPYQNPNMLMQQRQLSSGFKEVIMLPDEGLVSTLIGRKLRYDEAGRVIGDFEDLRPSDSIPPALDLSKYELFQDLYWWYCRQDAFQSIISGNRLLMDYSRWSDCPPRAPMGRADAIYACHDHVILILGRIADFAARDRERKIKVVEANGGQWRPTPGMPMGPPPQPGQAATGPTPPTMGPMGPSPNVPTGPPPGWAGGPPPGWTGGPPPGPPPGGPPQMPNFYGMAPTRAPTAMPSSYANSRQESPTSPPRASVDLEAAYKTALEDWSQIRAALYALEQHLGPAFQPLSAEYHQPLQTPFGYALQYRSYDIGIIWALLYMSHIVTIRSHPSMPPAAMMAAGVAAQQTAHYANEIGRIAAGI
ncbi:hypothetical protein AOQ84DRAFT_323304, partial [Glonium stellatum]